MSKLQKTKKASRGIVSRRKPKKTPATRAPQKAADTRKFNLALPRELFVLVAEAAAAKNLRINAFIANALVAELNLPTIQPVQKAPPKLKELNLFLETMGDFNWGRAFNLEECTKKDNVRS